MLHYNMILVALWAVVAQAQVPSGALTLSERAGLDRLLTTRTVEIRRRRPPPPGFTVPGGTQMFYQGWLAEADRVVTASLVTEGWPAGDGDLIEVRTVGGEWRSAVVGLMDAQVGIAVLDLTLSAPEAAPLAEDRVLRPGRQLFSAGRGQPVDVRIGQRGEGQSAWFWLLLGPPLPPGTPLFDDRGGLVTLVGAPGPLALPVEAMEELVKRRADWKP